jgi:hypothetical protein
MTAEEIDLIQRALELLHRLVAPEGDSAHRLAAHRSMVILFAERYLKRDALEDVTCAELWQFYREIVAAGDLEPVSKSEFLRLLPAAMETTFGVKKCHGILRDGVRLRGFRSVTLRDDT